LPTKKRTNKTSRSSTDISPLDGITFSFVERLSLRKDSTASTDTYYTACEFVGDETHSDSSRESDNSLYQIPCVPKAFMDTSVHSEDLHYLCTSRESDQISLSSTASSSGYPRRPDSGGVPLYIPMNNVRGGHSPSSNSKVSVSSPKSHLRPRKVFYTFYSFLPAQSHIHHRRKSFLPSQREFPSLVVFSFIIKNLSYARRVFFTPVEVFSVLVESSLRS
jgi:hypothetical protein